KASRIVAAPLAFLVLLHRQGLPRLSWKPFTVFFTAWHNAYNRRKTMKRYQKKDLFQTQYNPFEQPSIQQDAKIGIYGRQSTINQVKNNIGAGDMQIDDLVILAKRLGVHEDDIILYIENKREDG